MESKGDAHFLVCGFCVGHRRSLHFQERHQERERRFRALVFIDTVGMKSIFASAGCWIIERRLQVVLTQEPTEDAIGFLGPAFVMREPVCLKTCSDGGAGFDGLLIETGLFRRPR